ncbi:PAS domain S-box protein [Chryseobacterium gotjawalense]|uniref:histidine kinase n=1 Tax=Chryseobacterium gotjawalense TaxID=3042315 RepID=A0ABY8RA55_9FLAO|nr:PAS domain S-box protein [Chryseobacterium sp. wdc7]WHF50831.1 PAS domain S-box protein [Chryseobacterium sp. wdc7]
MKANFPQIPISLKENVLENVLQKTPFGFSLVNEDYVFEFANDEWLNIVQKTRQEVLGKKMFDIFPETQDQLLSIFEKVKENRESFYSPEHSIKLKRAGIVQDVFFNFVYQPIYSECGDLQYFAMVVIEVTDLVGIRNQIKDEEERLRLATESSHTATWDLNLKNSEIVHSSYLSQIFGYENDDEISHLKLRTHLVEYDRINIVDKAFERALKTGKYQYEARIIDKKGNLKWVFTTGKIFPDEKGQPARMLGVMQDITERKNNEILLQESHHQLNTALDATKLGKFDMDYETQKKYNFSPRFLSILGYDADTETIDSKVFESHIHPKYLKIRAAALKQAKETGDLFYQTKIILREGQVKWIEIYGRLLESYKGSKPYISGTMRDITDLKEFESSIKESEKKYRFLADAIPQIVWIGESDGRLTYFNQATMDYSGKNYNTFLEEDGWLSIVHPDEKAENLRLWMESVITKTPFTYEHRFRGKNDEYRWFLSRATPQLDELGNVKKWVGTSTDIDEMKRQDQHKNDFIKIANHELKTPVTTIKGYVQLLKKMRGNSGDKFLVNSLNTIENQINKLNQLMGELLDISRIESGQLPLHKGDFSLVKLVTETIEDIKAADQSHQINFELSHTSDVEVFADKDRITQVLNNLLTNAIKYSPDKKEVNVKLFIDGSCAVVSVEDFGIGMNEKELSKIFQRFYRVSGKDEVTFPGFGIGLFIVKDIMDRHQGKIWVESEKNKGSKFYFSLPLLKIK